MKTRFSFLSLLCALCVFSSCGGEKVDPENGGNGSGQEQEKPDGPYVDGSTTVAGHEALDLGTGLLWATTNLGAQTPEEYGDYYSWGEVAPKDEYRWGNYKWADGFEPQNAKEYEELKMTKYCLYKIYGTKDDKKVLDPEDDAATQSWGNGWRMPTKQEVDKLLSECSWEWARREGLYGYEVSSKKTGKTIFLPAAGMVAFDGHHNSAFMCNYWTASLHDQNEQYYAYSFVYVEEGKEYSRYISQTYRYLGMTIRPVCDK